MVALRACVWFLCSCLVRSNSSYHYPAWLEDQNENVTGGDAPERKLFLPVVLGAAVAVEAAPAVAAGMLELLGLTTAEITTVAAAATGGGLLAGTLATAVVAFAELCLSSSGVLTEDGHEVASKLQSSHQHRRHVAHMATIDVSDFLGIQLNDNQISRATDHMEGNIESSATDFTTWWLGGMKKKFVGGHTMKPMKTALGRPVRAFSLDMGHADPGMGPATFTWMTNPLPMLCALTLLGSSLAAAMRMWHKAKFVPCSEHGPLRVVDDVVLLE